MATRTSKAANTSAAAAQFDPSAMQALMSAMQGGVDLSTLQAQAKREKAIAEGGIVTLTINKNTPLRDGQMITVFVKQEGCIRANGQPLDETLQRVMQITPKLGAQLRGVGESFMDNLEDARAEYGQTVSVEVAVVGPVDFYKSTPNDGSEPVLRLGVNLGEVLGWTAQQRVAAEVPDDDTLFQLAENTAKKNAVQMSAWRANLEASKAQANNQLAEAALQEQVAAV